MARILAVGIATLDVVNTVERYPGEDSEVRAVSQRIARGGNATNTLAVLSQLGHRCAWGGVVADEPDGQRILADLAAHHIDVRACRHVAEGRSPVSYVTLSAASGSRSIVHFRDLPEFGFGDFTPIDLSGFDWIHFEGRNVADTARMLRHARSLTDAPLSLELEKPRDGLDALLPLADVLLGSRALAAHFGFDAAAEFLHDLRRRAPRADLVCAWGADGAWALARDGAVHHGPAHPPRDMVDTLGAGDTFNAGIIDARLRGLDWPEALDAANRLAGRKCGQVGLSGLG
jgi:ketohexokinase